MRGVLLVFTTLPDAESADRVARQLVEKRVAACVNRLPPCVSTYRWRGEVETASEVPLLIKTSRETYPLLERALRTIHPYEVPEIVAVPVQAGLPAYLEWVAQETEWKE